MDKPHDKNKTTQVDTSWSKTSLLNALTEMFDPHERIEIIEDIPDNWKSDKQ